MTKDETKDATQSAWLWPAEWAIERAFWRDVATRTIAGVLTIVVIGVPTLLWAAISGALRWETVAPVVIGIALVAILIVIYAGVVVGIRRREAQRIAEALAVESFVVSALPDGAMLHTLDLDQQRKILEALSETGKRTVRDAMRLARTQSRLAGLGAISSLVVAAVAAPVVEPVISAWLSSLRN